MGGIEIYIMYRRHCVEVRIATIGDVEELFLLNELFENTTTIAAIKKSIIKNDREIICIAYVEGISVGYCTGLIVKSMCYSEYRIDIEALYVRNKYRKQGIGEALISCLEKEAISQGVQHFHINTYSTNAVALSLYKKIGYTKTDEILLDKTIRK
jgi:Acetyltransferases